LNPNGFGSFVFADIGPAPSRSVRQQGFNRLGVQAMARTYGAVKTENRRTGQVKIAQRVERLVPHELIGEAQAFRIGDLAFIKHHRIVHRAAPGEAVLQQHVEVAAEAEGARRRDQIGERLTADFEGEMLTADGGIVKVDLDVNRWLQ
jgi:hypothetical protein